MRTIIIVIVLFSSLIGCSPVNVKKDKDLSDVVSKAEVEAEQLVLRRYIYAVQSAVTNQWRRPQGTDIGLKCLIKVQQIPGGSVIDVKTDSPCNANTEEKNSIINAVKSADPLPYVGFETVFARQINFLFQYLGD